MNIFVLSFNPTKAAQALCDKHVPKMLLEAAQMLCSVFPEGVPPYGRTHYNHTCTKWVRESWHNYRWLLHYGLALEQEYFFRFKKPHIVSGWVVRWCERHWFDEVVEKCVEIRAPRSFAQAIPDKYRHTNPVTAYRAYYIGEKARFAKWERGRKPPRWWPKEA